MLRKKKKTIRLIRHGESTFNVPPHDASVRDPLLTPTGQDQAKNLGQRLPSAELIVTSPLRRTLYTGLYAFDRKLQSESMRILAVPELQELSKYPCDTGSPLQDLEREFRALPVDLKLVHPSWDSKEGYWAPTERRSLERVREVRRWLRDRPEKDIVVIGHGHCLQLLVEEGRFRDIRNGLVYPEWKHTEIRSYHFDPKSEDEATLIETKESLEERERVASHIGDNDGKGNTIGSTIKSVRNSIPA